MLASRTAVVTAPVNVKNYSQLTTSCTSVKPMPTWILHYDRM